MASKSRTRSRSKETPNAQELLVMELQAIHSAESQLSRVLPRLSKASDSDKLRSMIDERLGEGERIIKDVEAGLDEVGESPGRRKNVAAEGLISDVREHVQELEAGPALDAVLIAGLQKTEHYCISAWGTAKALARASGQGQTVRAMERALKEGGAFDERLTALAEQEVTPALLAEDSGDEAQESAGASQRGKNSSDRRPHAA